MPSLTSDQLKQYEEEGYVAPIDVLSKEEAKEVDVKDLEGFINSSGMYKEWYPS